MVTFRTLVKGKLATFSASVQFLLQSNFQQKTIKDKRQHVNSNGQNPMQVCTTRRAFGMINCLEVHGDGDL